VNSAAVNNQTNEGVAIKKVTNVFSKKILAKRALREIKLLQHFRGHRNVSSSLALFPTSRDNISMLILTSGARSPACMIWTSQGRTISTRPIFTKVFTHRPALSLLRFALRKRPDM